jgi:hypothetical protein
MNYVPVPAEWTRRALFVKLSIQTLLCTVTFIGKSLSDYKKMLEFHIFTDFSVQKCVILCNCYENNGIPGSVVDPNPK